MKIKCNDCGYEFPEDEIESREEHIGDPFGFPAYERVYFCPNCHSTDLIDEDHFDDE